MFKIRGRFSPFISSQETRKGFSLIEMLIVISLLSILFGIAFVSYSAYIKNATLSNMRKIAEAFPNVVNTCVTSSGWEVTRPDGTLVHPCNTLERLDFVCPIAKKDCPNSGWPTTCCNLWVDPSHTHSYICLDVRSELKGKKHQLHVVVHRGDTNNYKVSCAEISGTYTDLNTTADCDPGNTALTDCDW